MTTFFIIAALVLLAIVALAIRALVNSATIKGITGERLTRDALERGLDPAVYRVLHDVTVPSRYGTTQIDHVVVSRYGVFVLETKHLFGWIFAQGGSNTWTQSFSRNRKFTFQNPLRQNHAHVKALEAVTGLGGHAFVPLVVMTGRAEFRTGMPAGVVEIADLVDEILRTRNIRLSTKQVDDAQAAIEDARLEPGEATDQAHVASLRERFGESTGSLAGSLKFQRQALTSLRAVALVLVAVVAWGAFSALGTLTRERLPLMQEKLTTAEERAEAARPASRGQQGEMAWPGPRTPQEEAGRPTPIARSVPDLQDRTVASEAGGKQPPQSLAFEPLALPHTQPPAPQIFIEPDPPVSQPAKLGTAPPRPPEERIVTTAEQRRLFEETLNCELTGVFDDCSCYMESGAKVLVGYERCRTLARYNGVEWISRPE